MLLSFWGVDQYGLWLILSAIPAYLSIADLGFSQAGASAMSMRVAAGDTRGASHVFEGGILLFCCISSAVLLGGIAYLLSSAFVPVPVLAGMSRAEGVGVVTLLAFYVILGTLFGTYGGGLRSVGLNAWLVTTATTGRLIEGLSTILVAGLGGGFLPAAIALVAIKLATVVLASKKLKSLAPWYHAKAFTRGGWAAFKQLLVPSVSFLSYTLAQLLSIQGITIAVGAIWGPSAVVMLTALRTFSRLGIQAANIVSYAWQPEFSRAFGDAARRSESIRRLALTQSALIIPLIVAYLTFSIGLGDVVIDMWTHGKVTGIEPLLTLMVLAVAIDMVWLAAQSSLIALNRHTTTSAIYCFLSFAYVGLTIVLGDSSRIDLVGYLGLFQSILMLLVVALAIYVQVNSETK